MMLNIIKFHKKSNFDNFEVPGPPDGENGFFLNVFTKKRINLYKEKQAKICSVYFMELNLVLKCSSQKSKLGM